MAPHATIIRNLEPAAGWDSLQTANPPDINSNYHGSLQIKI